MRKLTFCCGAAFGMAAAALLLTVHHLDQH